MLKKLFTRHPTEFNETYWEHCFCALTFSLKLFASGIGCFIHAFFPFIFVNSASNCAKEITKKMNDRLEINTAI